MCRWESEANYFVILLEKQTRLITEFTIDYISIEFEDEREQVMMVWIRYMRIAIGTTMTTWGAKGD